MERKDDKCETGEKETEEVRKKMEKWKKRCAMSIVVQQCPLVEENGSILVSIEETPKTRI